MSLHRFCLWVLNVTDLIPACVEAIWSQVSFQKCSPTSLSLPAPLTSLQTKPGSPEDYAGIWVHVGFAEGMRRLSPPPHNTHIFLSRFYCLAYLSVSFCAWLCFFLSPLIFSLNRRWKRVFGAVGIHVQWWEEEKKEEKEEEEDKRCCQFALLLLLHTTGRTKASPDRPDHPYLYPGDVSSPCVLTILLHYLPLQWPY